MIPKGATVYIKFFKESVRKGNNSNRKVRQVYELVVPKRNMENLCFYHY